MRVPGGNLYKMASKIIGGSAYTLHTVTRALDVRGIWVDTLSAGTALTDSIQAVDKRFYSAMGLDLAKLYIMIYTDNALMVSVDRDISGSQVVFQSATYQLMNETDWVPIDGWRGVLAVQIKATVPP